jgi:hypothetical protein
VGVLCCWLLPPPPPPPSTHRQATNQHAGCCGHVSQHAAVPAAAGWSDAPLALLLRYWCHLVLTASGGSSGGGRMWEVAAAVAEQREVANRVVPGGGLAGQGLPVDTEGAPLPEERDVQVGDLLGTSLLSRLG